MTFRTVTAWTVTRYGRGQLTVFGGSLWLCMRDTDGAARPGKSTD